MWALQTDHVPAYVGFADVFTAEECRAVMALGTERQTHPAVVEQGGLDETVRKSHVSWLTPSPETEWLFRRISDAVNQANEEVFKFDLFGMVDGIQYGEYRNDGGHYQWHLDSWHGIYPRKLSVSVQLSPDDAYSGGDLELNVGNIEQASRSQGSMTLFPSYRLHRVAPVTHGLRCSLVTWIAGPAFK